MTTLFKPIRAKLAVSALVACGALFGVPAPAEAQGADCPNGLRDLNIGVSVVPPNVVHTTPYVAESLGLFERYCINAEITAFEGGSSAAVMAALQQGNIIANVTAVMVGAGMKAHQIWGFAPRLPQSYVVAEEIKTAADLKGKRLSASGGGVGSFNWVMGRAMLRDAGLTVDDAQFISQGLAGRLPGLVTGQLDGVSLHPEDVFLATQQKPGAHVLVVLAEKMPDYAFNIYGAADDFIETDRDLLVDGVAAMIEANRIIHRDKDRVVPIMVEVSEKPQAAVEHAWDVLTRNCVWAVNTGLDRKRAEWTIANSVELGDIPADRNLTYEQLVDESIAEAALKKVGGPTEINGCSS